MNLYLLTQNEITGYDTYDSMVVAADTEYQAKQTNPSNLYRWDEDKNSWAFIYSNGEVKAEKVDQWANNLDNIQVRLIGKAVDDQPAGVVLASFKAG